MNVNVEFFVLVDACLIRFVVFVLLLFPGVLSYLPLLFPAEYVVSC